MDWLAENWVWVLIGIAFFAMHLGHGGHGGHGGSHRHDEPAPEGEDPAGSGREGKTS